MPIGIIGIYWPVILLLLKHRDELCKMPGSAAGFNIDRCTGKVRIILGIIMMIFFISSLLYLPDRSSKNFFVLISLLKSFLQFPSDLIFHAFIKEENSIIRLHQSHQV
jgi:hypothetical protein